MSYKPALPYFFAYNDQFQNATTASFDLEFDTFMGIDHTSQSALSIPDNSFVWGDCKSVKDALDSDERHSFHLTFTSTSLSAKHASFEFSGAAGLRNFSPAGDIAYASNKTGGAVSTGLRCNSLYNDYDQVANFNRVLGIYIA